MASDVQGILRGTCNVAQCDCSLFVAPLSGVRCAGCTHPPVKHVNLSTHRPPKACSTMSLMPSVSADGEDDGDTVVDHNGDREEGGGRWLPVRPPTPYRDRTPSPPPSSLPPAPSFAPPQTTLQLSPDQRCNLPGCHRPKYCDPATGRVHDFCGKGHALEHQMTQESQISPDQKCMNPACSKPKRPRPNGSGYFDFCGMTCSKTLQVQNRASLRRQNAFGNAMVGRDGTTRIPGLIQWNMPHGARASCTEITAGSRIFITVASKFMKTWASAKGPCPKVDHIFEVISEQIKQRWDTFKTSLATKGSPTEQEEHYHGTVVKCDLARTKVLCMDDECGLCGISQGGFVKKYIARNIPRLQRFGHGFYLAPHSSKCHDYTQGSHTHRAMLLCDVLPGKKHVVTTDQPHLTAPPPGYDSVYGQPGGSLNYPEIVLYEEGPILPHYVIMYQKDGIHKIAQ